MHFVRFTIEVCKFPFFKNPKTITSINTIHTLVSIGGLGFQAHSQHTFFQEWPPHLKLVGINGSD